MDDVCRTWWPDYMAPAIHSRNTGHRKSSCSPCQAVLLGEHEFQFDHMAMHWWTIYCEFKCLQLHACTFFEAPTHLKLAFLLTVDRQEFPPAEDAQIYQYFGGTRCLCVGGQALLSCDVHRTCTQKCDIPRAGLSASCAVAFSAVGCARQFSAWLSPSRVHLGVESP